MRFWAIFRFEFTYQVRRPWPWLFVAVLLLLDFLMTRDGTLSGVLYADFFLNSPFAVAKTTVFGGLLWLVMAAAVAGEAAARDVATRMHPLIYTTSVSKADYLGGRFLAALAINALLLLAVQAGILLGVYLPGVAPELIGPFRPAAFLTSYAFIALPNAFAATALQFLLAARSGRAMASYFGSFLIVFMGFFVASLLLYKRGLGALLDPIGIRFVVEDLAHLWTPIEKNRRLLGLEGPLLINRLLWLSIGLVACAVTYLGFRFAHRTDSSGWPARAWARLSRTTTPAAGTFPLPAPAPAGIGVAASVPVPVPRVARTFGFATHTRQLLAVAADAFRSIAASWGGLALLVVIPLLTVPVVLDQMSANDVPLLPTTPRVISELTASLSDELSRWVIIPFLIVYFAGELVWRERDARLSEITDAMPGSDWPLFLGKFLGLGLVLVVFLALQTAAGMLAQAMQGYQRFEVGLYLKILFGLQLTDYLLFALLALAVHVVANQKYVGHLVSILAFVFIALASLFGVEHNLLIYGASPGWSYTEMRGFGASLGPWLWFKLYWAAWALLLAVVARLWWVRGRQNALGERLRLARSRFAGSTAWVATVAAGLLLVLGGYIFYNTNVLNQYRNTAATKARAARYERRYGRYAATPQPQRTATSLHIEVYPTRRTVHIRGTYRLVNRSSKPLDSIHVATASDADTRAIAFDRPATCVLTDTELGHRVYALRHPLRPGDSLQLRFEVRVAPRGFRENGVDGSVVANGTSFTNSWLPAIGYQTSRELLGASDRREHGLAPRPVIASLYNVAARHERGGGTAFEAVVGTEAGQVAVAPGVLRRTWTAGGRRYFRYASDGPIGSEWAFFSARYAVHEAKWKSPDGSGHDVAIRVFHHPTHTAHLARMVRSIRASLNYYTQQFGPYRQRQLTVVERPGNGTGMHAEASMLSYGEGFSHWAPQQAPGSLDLPYAVVAHEMAHQWTVPYANVEGAPVMSESVAWYYAMQAIEAARGHEELERLRHFMRQPYPYAPIRRGEPLLRGLDPYLSYRRGPFALYTMSQYIGVPRVNGALRRLLEKHRSPGAPLATTLDLYRELQAATPDSLHYLLRDLFEVNTYWELKTKQATAQQTPAGSWQVTLQVQARKLVADSAGTEREVPMNDWVEVGVFAPRTSDEDLSQPLYQHKHRIRSGPQTLVVTVPRKPARAGIDPQLLLIDLNGADNVVNVR
ncbi:M1 family metallopeptidase [Hymenobacter busanensis]|uniref:M1 family metallopeptidase n=1 Tax=Hymenobacter busanensis TaxID=2607656 RepID=A0A7L4ZX00_9BACT|nr:ABC transporter permease [Hymenobacter busanensis]KAA9327700.1 M1 family metallopeptidase [Hymenobacter busanensis]QHJ05960.1 ABC transporter permease subunit [Hymenobacter busanensis]